MTGNEIFYENSKNCIFCKITQGFKNCLKKVHCITILTSPYPVEQVKAIPQPKHPLCTFPVSAATFELPIKRN